LGWAARVMASVARSVFSDGGGEVLMSRWEAWLIVVFWCVVVPVLTVASLHVALCDHLCRAR